MACVSKSLIQFAEKEERSLPSAASAKLYTIFLQLQQVQKAAKGTLPGKATVTNPAKLASRHKRKWSFTGEAPWRLRQSCKN